MPSAEGDAVEMANTGSRRRKGGRRGERKKGKDLSEEEVVVKYTARFDAGDGGKVRPSVDAETKKLFKSPDEYIIDLGDEFAGGMIADRRPVAGGDQDEWELEEMERDRNRDKVRAKQAKARDEELKTRIEDMVKKAQKDIEDEYRIDFASRAFVNIEPDADPDAMPPAVVHPNHVEVQLRSFIIYIFLGAIGLVTATFGVTLDIMTKWIRKFHVFLITIPGDNDEDFSWAGYIIWILFGVTVGFLAAKATDFLSPAAVGSGIPEMKCYLNGADRITAGGGSANRAVTFLSFKTLISKLVGLTLAIGSGMWVGKEGPYVHTSSIICNQMFRFFPSLNVKKRGNSQLRLQLIGAAVGIGVASHFGAVLGGVLFSIEVTSTYYPVRNYWFSAVGCGVGGLIFRVLHNLYVEKPALTSVIHTSYDLEHKFEWYDIFFFLFIGITCGLFSALFVRMTREIIMFRKRNMAKYRLFVGPIGYTVIVITVISILSYPNLWGEHMSSGGYPTLQDLVNSGRLDDGKNATVPIVGKEWIDGHGNNFEGVWKNLIIFFVFKFVMTPFAITAGVPAGLYVPTLLLGAAWGRLIGESLNIWADDDSFVSLPGGYATVAAAAMTGGITQTYSTAIIVLEITGQLVFSLPVIMAVTVAIMTTRLFYESIFDEIARVKNFMYLAELKYWRYNSRADQLMRRDFMFLTRHMNLRAILSILEARPLREDFPVLRSVDDNTLVGSVERLTLEKMVYEPIDKKLEQSQRRYWFNTAPPKRTPKSAAHLNKYKTLDYSDVPFQLLPSTPLYSIHILFITLRLKTVFITERGKLRGVIGRQRLQATLIHPEADADALSKLAGDL